MSLSVPLLHQWTHLTHLHILPSARCLSKTSLQETHDWRGVLPCSGRSLHHRQPPRQIYTIHYSRKRSGLLKRWHLPSLQFFFFERDSTKSLKPFSSCSVSLTTRFMPLSIHGQKQGRWRFLIMVLSGFFLKITRIELIITKQFCKGVHI